MSGAIVVALEDVLELVEIGGERQAVAVFSDVEGRSEVLRLRLSEQATMSLAQLVPMYRALAVTVCFTPVEQAGRFAVDEAGEAES